MLRVLATSAMVLCAGGGSALTAGAEASVRSQVPAAGGWTRLAVVASFADSAGMLRLAGGGLVLVWRQRQANGQFTYKTANLSATGKVVSTGTALSNWVGLENARLIPGGPAIRLVFIGGRTTNPSDFFSVGSVYTEVSKNGKTWTLVHATMSQHTVLNLGLAAVARSDKTPVAAFGLNNVLYYHVGLDPQAPAGSPDGLVTTGPVAVGLENGALARANDGSIWMAWYEGGPHRGYWAERILPTKGTPQRAPDSGTATSADNEPFQQVAFTARPHGGLYLAYCAPTKTTQCARLHLWRVGAARAETIPGSATGHAGRVAITAAPHGRLRLAWFDFGSSKIHLVQTGTTGSGFGSARTISQPGPAFIFNQLQAEGSAGRLDLIVNITVTKPTARQELWHIQVP